MKNRFTSLFAMERRWRLTMVLVIAIACGVWRWSGGAFAGGTAQQNQLAPEFQSYLAHIAAATFSPDGKRIAASSSGDTTKVWEVDTG